MAKFHQTLSDHGVYMRYLHILPLGNRVQHERLAKICHGDQEREMVLVAETNDPQSGERRIIGVGRWNRFPGSNDAEMAVLVADEFQNRGVGTALILSLAESARARNLRRLIAEIHQENLAMQHVASKLGFRLSHEISDPIIIATFDL